MDKLKVSKPVPIKIAYLIIAYMDPKQLRRLVERLSYTADVYIHINASVEIEPFFKYLRGVSGRGRIKVIKKRYRVAWGGYSILRATFALLEDAMHFCQYERLILLTGLDYPIKSDIAILNFFEEHRQTEYVHASVVKGAFQHYVCRDYRMVNKLLQLLERMRILHNQKGKTDKIIYKNKEYLLYGCAPKWALTGEAAAYLLRFWKTNRKFNREFYFMHAPDDFYVATVLFHSKYRKYIDSEKDIFKIIWIQNKGAKILTEKNFEELLESDQLYAKKFQSNYYSVKLIRMLESEFKKEYERSEEK